MNDARFPSLSGHLLVAMPGMADPNFNRGVTLLCQHNEEGAVGLVINKVADFDLGKVLRQLDLEPRHADIDHTPVLIGGPVQPERGFVIHKLDDGEWQTSHAIDEQWAITTSRDILEALALGSGPSQSLLALGYAGWSAGQLEQELTDNAWLAVPATRQILFDTEVGDRWQAATQLLGIESHQLSHHIGHA